MNFTSVARGIFEVESKGNFYRTDIECKTCTCAGFYYKGYCKHLKFLGVGIYDRAKKITKEEINKLSKSERHILLMTRKEWIKKERKKDKTFISSEMRREYSLFNYRKILSKRINITKGIKIAYEVVINKDEEIFEYLYFV